LKLTGTIASFTDDGKNGETMKLQQIKLDSKPEDFEIPQDSPAGMNIKMQVEFYSKTGFEPPWVGYIGTADGSPVGLGAFKGPPIANKVEIAYFTFPEKEGQGLGTKMCRALVEIAKTKDPLIEVTARTLPEKNASTRILEKNEFVFNRALQDPEDGEVWEWTL
jgi:[ribosomal protein S5]-alanine N-acetyltransferase